MSWFRPSIYERKKKKKENQHRTKRNGRQPLHLPISWSERTTLHPADCDIHRIQWNNQVAACSNEDISGYWIGPRKAWPYDFWPSVSTSALWSDSVTVAVFGWLKSCPTNMVVDAWVPCESKSVAGDLCASVVSGVRISAHVTLGISVNGYSRNLTHPEMSFRLGIVDMEARRDLISDSNSCHWNQFLHCSI